jgi:hypothetical protein
VYSNGVYVRSKMFFAIWHSQFHLFEDDVRKGKKRAKSKGKMRDIFIWAEAGKGAEKSIKEL